MVQILPYVPSFGEQIMPQLAQTIGNIAQNYQQNRANRNDQKILQGLATNPNSTPLEQISAFNQLSKEKRDSLTPLFTQYMKTQQKQQETSAKQNQEAQEKQQKLSGTEEILNNLEALKKHTGPGHRLANTGRSGVQKRQQIDSEAIALEGYFRDLATKGALPQKTFAELLKRLPNSKMTEAQYQGAIDGIRDIIKAHSQKSEPSSEKKRPPLESFG